MSYAAVVVARDSSGRILLCRGPSWSIPGGKLEDGEGARTAAAREFTEETGLACNPADLREVGVVKTYDGRPMTVFTISCAVPDRFPGPEGECRMFSLADSITAYREDWREAYRGVLEVCNLKWE